MQRGQIGAKKRRLDYEGCQSLPVELVLIILELCVELYPWQLSACLLVNKSVYATLLPKRSTQHIHLYSLEQLQKVVTRGWPRNDGAMPDPYERTQTGDYEYRKTGERGSRDLFLHFLEYAALPRTLMMIENQDSQQVRTLGLRTLYVADDNPRDQYWSMWLWTCYKFDDLSRLYLDFSHKPPFNSDYTDSWDFHDGFKQSIAQSNRREYYETEDPDNNSLDVLAVSLPEEETFPDISYTLRDQAPYVDRVYLFKQVSRFNNYSIKELNASLASTLWRLDCQTDVSLVFIVLVQPESPDQYVVETTSVRHYPRYLTLVGPLVVEDSHPGQE